MSKLNTIDLRKLRDEYDELSDEREPYTDFLEANPGLSDNTKLAAISLMLDAWDIDREERWRQLDELFTYIGDSAEKLWMMHTILKFQIL